MTKLQLSESDCHVLGIDPAKAGLYKRVTAEPPVTRQKYQTTLGTIDGSCIHCGKPFAGHHVQDVETYLYMCVALNEPTPSRVFPFTHWSKDPMIPYTGCGCSSCQDMRRYLGDTPNGTETI